MPSLARDTRDRPHQFVPPLTSIPASSSARLGARPRRAKRNGSHSKNPTQNPRNPLKNRDSSRIFVMDAHQPPNRWRHHARTPTHPPPSDPVPGAMPSLAAHRHRRGWACQLCQRAPNPSNLSKPVLTRPMRARRRKTNPPRATQCDRMQPAATPCNQMQPTPKSAKRTHRRPRPLRVHLRALRAYAVPPPNVPLPTLSRKLQNEPKCHPVPPHPFVPRVSNFQTNPPPCHTPHSSSSLRVLVVHLPPPRKTDPTLR
jgi:hypothetical protein